MWHTCRVHLIKDGWAIENVGVSPHVRAPWPPSGEPCDVQLRAAAHTAAALAREVAAARASDAESSQLEPLPRRQQHWSVRPQTAAIDASSKQNEAEQHEACE